MIRTSSDVVWFKAYHRLDKMETNAINVVLLT